MKHICYLIITIGCLTCSSVPLDPGYYDDGSFYYVSDRKIEIYPSRSILGLKFRENVSLNQALEIIKTYPVRLCSEFYLDNLQLDNLFSDYGVIFIKTAGRGSVTGLITQYPKDNNSYRLGNHQDVQYCLRNYSFGNESCSSGFLSDKVVLKASSDSLSIVPLIRKYKLKHVPRKYLGRNVFMYELTESSPKGPLEIANILNLEDAIEWANPNFLVHTCIE